MMQGFLRPVGTMLLIGVFIVPLAGRIAHADEFKMLKDVGGRGKLIK